MSAKHTPGPWAVATENAISYGVRVIAPGAHDVQVAFCGAVVSSDPGARITYGQAIINARLIAAAPDMLIELRDAVAIIEALGGKADTQRAVIARADGAP